MSTSFVVDPPPVATRDVAALDPLAPYLADADVTDLFINGPCGLFVDRGAGAAREPAWRASEREVRDLAVHLIAAGGRHVDDAHPCVDVRLPGGLRVHVVLAPVATAGTAISIRVPRPALTHFDDLVSHGLCDANTADFLHAAVERRANFLISGAAGAGKTTLLAALLGEASPSERIITIEDVAELSIDHPQHIALQARQANLEGVGEIGLGRLVREALRMKPDRLVVGECRGAEVRELLTALNTGHDGGAGTVHANSLADVAPRLEALGALSGLQDIALARQVTSAMEFVVHVQRDARGRRTIGAIGSFTIAEGRLAVIPRENARHAARTQRARRRGSDDAVRALVAAESVPPVPPDAEDAGGTSSARTVWSGACGARRAEHLRTTPNKRSSGSGFPCSPTTSGGASPTMSSLRRAGGVSDTPPTASPPDRARVVSPGAASGVPSPVRWALAQDDRPGRARSDSARMTGGSAEETALIPADERSPRRRFVPTPPPGVHHVAA